MSLADILYNYSGALAAGLWVTFELCLISWAASFLMGSLLGLLAAGSKSASLLVQTLAAGLAGVPVIVFLFWVHYPAQSMIGIVAEPFVTACVALSILGTFMVAEGVRHAIAEFPEQYIVAARVSGLKDSETFWKVMVPIITRGFMPHGLLILVTIFHMSLLTSLISVEEIFRVAQRINSVVYRPVEIYTALAAFCLTISLPLHVFAIVLRARTGRDVSER